MVVPLTVTAAERGPEAPVTPVNVNDSLVPACDGVQLKVTVLDENAIDVGTSPLGPVMVGAEEMDPENVAVMLTNVPWTMETPDVEAMFMMVVCDDPPVATTGNTEMPGADKVPTNEVTPANVNTWLDPYAYGTHVKVRVYPAFDNAGFERLSRVLGHVIVVGTAVSGMEKMIVTRFDIPTTALPLDTFMEIIEFWPVFCV